MVGQEKLAVEVAQFLHCTAPPLPLVLPSSPMLRLTQLRSEMDGVQSKEGRKKSTMLLLERAARSNVHQQREKAEAEIDTLRAKLSIEMKTGEQEKTILKRELTASREEVDALKVRLSEPLGFAKLLAAVMASSMEDRHKITLELLPNIKTADRHDLLRALMKGAVVPQRVDALLAAFAIFVRTAIRPIA